MRSGRHTIPLIALALSLAIGLSGNAQAGHFGLSGQVTTLPTSIHTARCGLDPCQPLPPPDTVSCSANPAGYHCQGHTIPDCRGSYKDVEGNVIQCL